MFLYHRLQYIHLEKSNNVSAILWVQSWINQFSSIIPFSSICKSQYNFMQFNDNLDPIFSSWIAESLLAELNHFFCQIPILMVQNFKTFGLKGPKLHFSAISGSSKFIANTNIQIHVTCSIFIINIYFFEMLITMSSIRINNNWNYPKNR